MDRRRSLRFRARFDTLISADAEEGAGVLAEISYAGARLDDASTKPPVGTMYELFDPEIRQLVDDVSAIVNGPSEP